MEILKNKNNKPMSSKEYKSANIKRNRIIYGVCAVVAFVAVVAGIFYFTGNRQRSNNNEAPKSAVEGFYASNQKYLGGSEKENNNVNISELGIETLEGNTNLNFKFMYGSKTSGLDVAKINNVPSYTIVGLPEPNRFYIKFDAVTFWDYESSLKALEENNIIVDIFKPFTNSLTGNENQSQPVYVFFQLNSDFAYKVKELEDTLTITIQKTGEVQTGKNWYVTSNAYYDFQKIADSVELYPTASDNLSGYLLISKPFATKEEADAFAATVKPILTEKKVSDVLSVVETDKGARPKLDTSASDSKFLQKNIIRVNGKDKPLQLLMPYGQYLCSTPDGKKMLFSKNVSMENGAGGFNTYTELWLTEFSGKTSKLNVGEFAAVDKAVFSKDGKKLAILNKTSTNSLYTYNFETAELLNLSEEGLGNMVSGFTWDETGNFMFAVAGDNGQYQLKKFDFSKPEGERVAALSEQPLSGEGNFEFFNGELYYNVQKLTETGYDGTIFKIDQTTLEQKQVAKGIEFKISSDGKYMAVKDITDQSIFNKPTTPAVSPDPANPTATPAPVAEQPEDTGEIGEGSKVYGLKIIDLSTNTERRIATNEDVSSFVFDNAGAKVYYTLGNQVADTAANPFVYGLHTFDTASSKITKLLDSTTDQFSISSDPDKLLVSDFVDEYFATYTMTLSQLNN